MHIKALTKSIVFAALCVGLAACNATPQPFRSISGDNELLKLRSGQAVTVLPVQGVDPDFGLKLADAMAAALSDTDVPASVAEQPNGINFSLVGLVQERSRTDGLLELDVVWSLSDTDGAAAGLYRHQALVDEAAWMDRKASALVQVVAGGVDGVNEMMQDNPVVVAEAPEPERQADPVRVAVGTVNGAPGNGGTALPEAMRRALRGVGIQVVEDSAAADFLLTADVSMTAPKAGAQRIGIVWNVIGRGGVTAGTTNQNNQIKAGSLDAEWGKVAGMATAAVAPGIAQIINETEVAKRQKPGSTEPEAEPADAVQTASLEALPEVARPAPSAAPAQQPSRLQPAAVPAGTTIVQPARAIALMPESAKATARPSPGATPAPKQMAKPSATTPWMIQLAASRTVQQAEAFWGQMAARHGDVLNDLSPRIQRVDLPGRGTYHRVQAGAFTKASEARTYCRVLKQRNSDCIVVRAGG
ncbi:MAG: SPOR domain-containing protein [Magnetovibrionaceae bacterium]